MQTTDSWFYKNCRHCGSNVVICQATEKDYHYYCSQKTCKNHEGIELYDMDEDPEFVFEFKDHADGIIIESNKVLQKYVGQENSEIILSEIEKDLQNIINKYLEKNEVFNKNFPIEFENDFGRWKFYKDGKCDFSPKSSIKFVNLNFTVLPTGVDFCDNNDFQI